MNASMAVKKIKVQQDFKGKFKYWNKLCNFLAVVRAVELELNTLFTLQETLDGLRDLIAFKLISPKGGLHKGESYKGLARYFSALRDKKFTSSQVGFIRNKSYIGWDGSQPDFQYVQLKWLTGLGNQHWTLADKEGNEIYDAWDEDIDKVRIVKRYLITMKDI